MSNDPAWLTIARTHIGLREIPGPRHSPVILRWLRDLNAWWSEDETAWCGTYVAHCVKEAGLPIPKLWMRAKEWSNYGSLLRRDRLAPGAILVFNRQGGGHVGFYIGHDATHYHVLGGNQANGVNVMRLLKSRLEASRWPKGVPVIGAPVHLNANGTPVSHNEG
jgi:uncharacterized protein (TIGR02594 family)